MQDPRAAPVTVGPPAELWRQARRRWPGRLVLTAQQHWPGAGLCAVIALAATAISAVHHGPPLLYALLLGMSLHSLGEELRAQVGIDFCARFVLRLGVALLGVRITAAQVLALGWPTALGVALSVLATIAVGLWLARRLGLPAQQGLLSGAACAICGASAALAVASVLPRSRENDRFTLLVVVCVTSLSTLAMLLYPVLARGLGLSPTAAGIFLGASIHDVAQVAGAGYILGAAVGDTAVVVKLLRVSLLSLVIVVITVSMRLRGAAVTDAQAAPARPAWVPWFLQLFLLLVGLNSARLISAPLQLGLAEVSRICLVLAIAALGLKTDWRALLQAGWRPLLLLVAETVFLAGLVLAGLKILPG